MLDVWDVIGRFQHDERLGLTAVVTPANLCEGSIIILENQKLLISLCSKMQLKRWQNNDIKKYMDIDVGYIEFCGILDWWKKREKFRYLSRVSRNVFCLPTTSASSKRNFSVARLVVQKYQTSLSSKVVDSILFVHNMQ
jgi:hypothetical protein